MINLMYLVLTALLALNVSAEVMNAFQTIDDSLADAQATTDRALDDQQRALSKLLTEDSKKDFRRLEKGITDIRTVVAEFNTYINGIKDQLIDGSGVADGVVDDNDYKYPDDPAKRIMKGLKNKDVTTRLLAEAELGDELEAKIAETKQKLIDAYAATLRDETLAAAAGYRTESGALDTAAINADIRNYANNISLGIDPNWRDKAGEDKDTWKEYRFKQMPALPAITLLTTYQADAKNAEALGVGELASKAGGKEIVFDKFFPVINAEKAYVIKGEKFNAKVSLGAYSSDIKPENVRLTVNGRAVRMNEDGTADISETAGSTGTKTLKLSASVTNPLTGEVQSSTDEFKYEVGVRSAAVSADKMNVFYMGVDNPVSVSVAGANSNEVKVSASGGTITKTGNGKYNVRVANPGDVRISVSGGGMPSTPFDFRAKRIPDPVARLGNMEDGSIGNGTFKAQKGVIAWLDNFDFDAKCKIDGFEVTRVPKRQDPVTAPNRGGTLSGKADNIVNAAKPGDQYFFRNIKARCPGDKAGRKVNSLVFTIK